MKVANKGTGNRYARDLGGNHIEAIRSTATSNGVFIAFGKRFCETCQTLKPKDSTPAKKGWKCKDCKTKTHNAKVEADGAGIIATVAPRTTG
jgi:hypothetical protein